MTTIWARIKRWAERKERKAWMDKYHCDQRCYKCDTWQANCGGWRKVVLDAKGPFYDVLTCGKCGQEVVMFDFGMGYIAVDSETLKQIS